MANLASTKIKVFPSAKRVGYQKDSRLITEASLVNIINQLIDVKSFVITPEDDLSADNPFEFNIGGYYFKVDKLSDLTNLFAGSQYDTMQDIYATITISTDQHGYTELMGQDDDQGGTLDPPIYMGVTFSNTASSSSGDISLKVLHRESVSDSWVTPETSRFKYDSTAVELQIDGGIIS